MELPLGPVTDRRRVKRSRIISEHGVLLARVRPGHQASIIDISVHGTLIETVHRLLPGSPIELHLETSRERLAIRGRVLRCSVTSVVASSICYHGAIHFDRSLARLTDATGTEYSVLVPDGMLSLQP